MQPIGKKAKLTENSVSNESESDSKRKQVDAHVQAFLKAVLDHAQSGSFNEGCASLQKKKTVKEKRDVWTQTEAELDGLSEDNSSDTVVPGSYTIDEDENATRAVSSHVPNRAMYSEETLSFFSQQGLYSNEALRELSSHSLEGTHYSSQVDYDSLDKCGPISSVEIKKAIDQWAKNYREWFFQNFGMDVLSVCRENQTANIANFTTNQSQISEMKNVTINPVSIPISMTEQPSVPMVSRPPLSYIVPQGSLCMPDNKFLPYFSLVPSFYTPAAFSHVPHFVPNITQTFGMTTVPSYPNISTVNVLPLSLTCPILPSPTCTSTQIVTNPILVAPPVASVFPPPCPTMTVTTPEPQTKPISFADLPTEVQASAMLATLALPGLNGQSSHGQWGPSLRNGIYGRLPLPHESEMVNAQKQPFKSPNLPEPANDANSNPSDYVSTPSDQNHQSDYKKMPPPPPFFILLKRQAMICALQVRLITV